MEVKPAVDQQVRKVEPKIEKKKKPKPKTIPAKIIKLAEVQPPEPEIQEPVTKMPLADIVLPSEKVGKKEKEIKKSRKEEKEELTPKREYRRRRREVFERKDLYGDAERGFVGKAKLKTKAKLDKKKFKQTEITVPKAIKRRVKVPNVISVAELAKRMGVKAAELIKKLMEIDIKVTLNQTVDFDSASLVAGEFGYELELSSFEEEDILTDDYHNGTCRPWEDISPGLYQKVKDY